MKEIWKDIKNDVYNKINTKEITLDNINIKKSP